MTGTSVHVLGRYLQVHARLQLQAAQVTAAATGGGAVSLGQARLPFMCTVWLSRVTHAAHAHQAHKDPQRSLGAGTGKSLLLKHISPALPAFES